MKVTDEMVEAALKAYYSAWGTAKKSQDMYRDAMRAALEAVIPLPDPAAWQWLDTANFRKAIPESSNPSEWNPLYRHPALSHAAGQDGEQCRAASGDAGRLASKLEDVREGIADVLPIVYLETIDDAIEALRALSRGVPEGMVLVPVEPTREMLDAAGEVVFRNSGEIWTGEGFAEDLVRETQKQCWDAAIAAQRKEG